MMRQLSLLAAAATGGAAVPEAATQFAAFKQTYGVTYASPAEEARRMGIFAAALRRIDARNADPADGATYGVTRWADRTAQERRGKCGGAARDAARMFPPPPPTPGGEHSWDRTCYAKVRAPKNCDNATAIPEAWDWGEHGAVTPVKDQGDCGNCFIFAAAGDMEASWYLAGHDLVSLSEQQFTSCDRVGGDGGCNGGASDMDTNYYAAQHGVTSEANYPYCSGTKSCTGNNKKEKLNGVCDKKKEAQPVANFTNAYVVSGGMKGCNWCDPQPIDEELMKEHIFRAGPLNIGIDSTGPLEDYVKGVMNPSKCPNKFNDLDHQVMIVGYGTSDGVDYWRIKNSWGPSFGEKGYVRVARGRNVCGVASGASHAVASPAIRGGGY